MALNDASWRGTSSADLTPQAQRSSMRISIRNRKAQLCCWHGCLDPPKQSGKPYCEKHTIESRSKKP